MSETLTTKEINILMEALEAWENKDDATGLMVGLMGAMIIPDNAPEEAKRKLEVHMEEHEQKREREKKDRKDTSLLLRAKLVQIRANIVIEEANGCLQ